MNKEVLAFGRVIQKQRKLLKMTQEELAYRSSLNRTFISYVENGRKIASIVSLFAFARGLHIPAADLIRQVEDELNRLSDR
ncbi:helix-turn-helix domain-containing protein [Paenibacillus chartarius]|uniref:Helix-turn-helix domain-containing protein n=1 Tax=Paenibacillus chartarius TaxID=747481 RepID=A0ABV6DMD8_9BACL